MVNNPIIKTLLLVGIVFLGVARIPVTKYLPVHGEIVWNLGEVNVSHMFVFHIGKRSLNK